MDRDRDFLVVEAVLAPLLRTLDALAIVARNFHPPLLARVLEKIGTPEEALRAAAPRLGELPEYLSGVGEQMKAASEAALAGLEGLRTAAEQGDHMGTFRALRNLPRAMEALYPLASILPPVNRFFLEPERRNDETLQKRFIRMDAPENTGVMHFGEAKRGGFSLYVPEDYSAERDYPLVMALHGGSGNGRTFLWSWLTAARTRGAIVAAPTSLGPTWALQGEDVDTPVLHRLVDFVSEHWRADQKRLLLTGMSDGGTFAYLSGLDAGSRFTHLAPVSAAFVPMFAQMWDGARVRGLPVHIVHGALDWMFPLEMPRGAERALKAAGADVRYVEMDDLSHTFPREMCGVVLEWVS